MLNYKLIIEDIVLFSTVRFSLLTNLLYGTKNVRNLSNATSCIDMLPLMYFDKDIPKVF